MKSEAEEIEADTKLSVGLVGWPFQDGDWKATWKD